MFALACIMFLETFLKILGYAYIMTITVRYTLKYINVVKSHIDGLPRRSSPQLYIIEKSGFAP